MEECKMVKAEQEEEEVEEGEVVEEKKKKKNTTHDNDDFSLAHCITPKSLSVVAYDKTETSPRRKIALIDHDKATQCAKERAEEVEANLDPRFPSFVKTMIRSHVTIGFSVALPPQFCKSYLPRHDAVFTLLDENQEEYPVKFLLDGLRLSAGWRVFSIEHELVEGDALVFHLIKATIFQVYIIRAYSLGAIDGIRALLSSDSQIERTSQYNAGKHLNDNEKAARKRQKATSLAAVPLPKECSRNGNEEVCVKVVEDTRLLEKNVEFKSTSNLESFTTAINNSEISKDICTKYYRLCCSQNAFLHNNLIEGTNIMLMVGAISDTVDIAESIKASKLSTFQQNFAAMDESLQVLKQLGMDVGFLRDRLHQLKRIALESEAASKQCESAQVERTQMEEEIRSVKAKLAELEKASKVLDSEIETLEMKARSHELQFQSLLDSPW